MTFSRRDFLKTGLTLGTVGAVGASGLLTGCGTGNTVKAFTASTAGKPRRGGTLRVGLTGGSSADTLNPLNAITNVDFSRIDNLYEPLIGLTPDAQPVFVLAEELTPNAKATEWTLRLARGITFHDGKDLTADDVIYTFRQILNPKAPAAAAAGLASIDAKNMTKLDTHTVRIPCTTPFATLRQALAIPGYSDIIPVGFDPMHPVGTGAFRLKSFSPGTQSTFVRYDGYWQSGRPYLDEIVITDYSDETSQVNALLAGQVDVVNLLSEDVISEVQGVGKNVLVSWGGGWNPFTMRVDTGTFKDVRVRQATRLAIDRKQMLDLIFGGYGTLGNDLFRVWAPEYDHGLPQREQDIGQAKSLLKAAGAEGLHVQLVTSDIAQGTVLAAQVLAQQAAAAGITISVNDVTVNDFYGTNYLKWQFARDYWFYNFYLPQVSLATLPTAPFNETHWSNTRYVSLYRQAIATVDDALRTELAHEMQKIEYDEGGYIIPFFPPVIDGYGTNVGGLLPSKIGLSLNAYDFGTQLREVFTIHGTDPGRLTDVLAEAGLEDPAPILAAYPHQLSGGQQQRVALAMAFACRPRLIVLDEPTTGLDVTTQRRVLDTVRGLCRSYQVAAVYITHDLAVVAEIADHVAVLYAGRLIELGQARELFATPAHPYTRGLMRAVPVLESTHELHGMAGSPPRPGSRPPGCFFQPRCEFAIAQCEQRQPDLITVSATGHAARCVRAVEIKALSGTAVLAGQRPVPPAEAPVLTISGVSVSYTDKPVLRDVNLVVGARQSVAIVGTSGSGKTTLARCVVGLHKDWSGTITFAGAELPPGVRRRTQDQLRRIQFVSQNPYSSLNPRQTVGQIVGAPLAHFRKLSGAEHKQRIGAALTSVALRESFAGRYPDELSGGERQRVALARALVVDPDLLVCDEVTSALDVSVQAAIVELLLRLQAERGLALLFITHNLPLVRSIADDVTVISAGEICERGPVTQVLSAPSHAYTRQLLADVPSIG